MPSKMNCIGFSAALRHESQHRRAIMRLIVAHLGNGASTLAIKGGAYIGSPSAALDGLDWLVFTGGIGANEPEIRERICEEVNLLGIDLDSARYRSGEQTILHVGSGVYDRAAYGDVGLFALWCQRPKR